MTPIAKSKNIGIIPALSALGLFLMLVCFSTKVQAQDFIQIKNRWQKDGKTNYRIHIQNPTVDAGATDPNWWSAQWVFEPITGTEFFRIKNRWQKDGKSNYYLHNQNGKIEAGPAEPGWFSAMWSLEKVDASYYRIKNRWKPDQFLHIQDATLAAGPAEPGWWSAMWELEGYKGNTTTNTTTDTDVKRAPITGVGFGAVPTPAADLAFVRKIAQVSTPAGFGAGANTSNMPKVFLLDMPPIGSQGNEGSCVAWACGYAAKSFEMKKASGLSHTLPGTNVMNIVGVASPEYLFNRINLNNNDCVNAGSCFVGSGSNRGALDVLKTEGVVTWAEAPYSDKNGCGTVDNAKEPVSPNAAKNQIKNYAQIKDLSEASLKTLLLDQHPIVFAAYPSDDFMSAGSGFVWRSGEGPSTRGHAMTIIGFDDSKKAFKVQNSWGTTWGDNGYTWLDYDFAKTAIKVAYVTYSDNLNNFRVETPGFVTVYSEAGYVSWCKLSYTLPNGENKVIEENLSLFFTFKQVIPPGSTNITLEVGGYAVLDPLKIKQTWSTSNVQACYKIWGTIFDTEYANTTCSY